MIPTGLDDKLPPESERPEMCEYFRCESIAEYVIVKTIRQSEEKYCQRHAEKVFFLLRAIPRETDAFPGLKEVKI